MRFTADEAFDAADCGEPILMDTRAVLKIIRDHDADPSEFEADVSPAMPEGLWDAADVLRWLGY